MLKDVILNVLHKTSVYIIQVVHFSWTQHLNGIPLVRGRHVLRVGRAYSVCVILHSLIPCGPSIIIIKLPDELLTLE